MEESKNSSFVEIPGVGKLDVGRIGRRGLPEVIYAEHKTPSEVERLFSELMKYSPTVLATRASKEHFELLRSVPDIEYHERARIIRWRASISEQVGLVKVLCAGTSDIPVAQEAALTAESFGSRVEVILDVGVAGIDRILSMREELNKATVLVVVAGMDGALPSVVGGLAKVPVIAVPTSTGYGASFGGVSALLSMINSCSPGVSVVNIDNGFGAGYQAHVINAQSRRACD
jgi:NCAIR mutase (PurE)-related protein